MKFNRRSIFGLGAGAAIAGPSMAREAAMSLGDSAKMYSALQGGVPLTGYGRAVDQTSAPDPGWILDRAKRLKAMIAGEDDEKEQEDRHYRDQNRLTEERFALVAVDSLKSVSPINKLRMLHGTQEERIKRARAASAERDLKRLHDEYPLLGLLA